MEVKPRILVVDDSEFIVQLIESSLSVLGYTITKAYDGEEALEKVAAEIPDLIILDVMMPKMSGLEVCQRLKKNDRTMMIPVVLLTAKNYVEDKITGLESGADDYITKPFNVKELQVRIQGLINKMISHGKKVENEKQEALESMAEEVAHEVRNPVTAIGGFARRIKTKLPSDSPLIVYAEKIISEAERLERMVNEIAAFKGSVVSLNEMVDIREVMNRVITFHADSLSGKNIEIKSYYAPGVPSIKGDSLNLKLVFDHILRNAIESIDHSGSITVKIGTKEDGVILVVEDTGCGINDQELIRITRPFYTSKMSGAGMGLVIVKYIVEAHSGQLGISSEFGKGTRVKITLPLNTVV